MGQTPAVFFDAIKRVEAASLDLMGLISAADALSTAGDVELSLVLYKYWLLANPSHPLRHVPAFNCGSVLLTRGDLQGAKDFLERAIVATPDFYPARLNLASALERLGTSDLAVAELQQVADRLSAITQPNISTKIHALKNMARIQRQTEAAAAERALRLAVEIDPAQRELVQHWVNIRQGLCIWPALEPVGTLGVGDVLQRMAPLSMSSLVDDPVLQLATAWTYSNQVIHAGAICRTLGQWLPPEKSARSKIKIGYLSSDFCGHAVGYLICDIFEFHNRDRFEITVFNLSERTNDPIQLKIMAGVDAWVDIRGVSDKEAASLIIARDIDILLDMNGHTNYQRPRLLAMKPAPIIANWLGYPGTMGSEAHQYVIADDFIIPPSHEKYYSEKVVRLPCYQPNGRLYEVPPLASSRAELGLPESGVVYCCFNGAVKITEPVFSRWMVILSSVPGSVLWLRGAGNDAERQLRNEAVRRGVAPDRLVFLPFRSNTEYLGCHRHADVFLDTFPYGAHTTASDALRMAIPIVTLAGIGFASRVCGSLSHAVGMPDLVCDTPEHYVALAIELGNNHQKREKIKERLRLSLPGSTLFDAKKLVHHLEALFEEMWLDFCAGSTHQPQSPDLSAIYAARGGTASVGGDVSGFMSLDAYERRERVRGEYGSV